MLSTTPTAARRRHRSLVHRLPAAVILLISFILSWSNNDGTTSLAVVSAAADATTQKKPSAGPQGVYNLNAKNFDSSLRDGKVWLVEFYAPWCGHCTRFASTYELVAHQLHLKQDQPGAKRKVNVAKVDGAAERALSSRFGVHGFPVFFLVDGWTVREFEGNRSQENLVKFAMTDYENTEPVPFLFGPFGPMGQLRSMLMRSGAWAIGRYEYLTEKKGMSPLVAMAVLCVGGLVVGLVSIIVVGLLFLPKAKQD
ncbi:hypothetical protein ACHAXR_005705 [Thalassiosira sp. AJA248-18]